MSELHPATPHPGPDLAELKTRLRSAAASDRLAAAEALGSRGGPAVQALCAALYDPDEAVRIAAAQSLGRIGSPAIRAQAARMESDAAETRERAMWALAYCGPAAVPVLAGALESSVWDTRLAAVQVLGRLHLPEVVPHLLRTLTDREPRVRIAAVEALGAIGDETAVRPLHDLLRSEFVGGPFTRRWRLSPTVFLVLALSGFLLLRMLTGDLAVVTAVWAVWAVVFGFGIAVDCSRERIQQRGRVTQAVTEALVKIAERRPSPEMRQVLPDLRRMVSDPLVQNRETRQVSRAAIQRIEALTESLKTLPLPGTASGDEASLPRVGEAPSADPQTLPRVR
ncbi:MAG: HEAT repeat domain-containing protein [Armatimonadota bacterium]